MKYAQVQMSSTMSTRERPLEGQQNGPVCFLTIPILHTEPPGHQQCTWTGMDWIRLVWTVLMSGGIHWEMWNCSQRKDVRAHYLFFFLDFYNE